MQRNFACGIFHVVCILIFIYSVNKQNPAVLSVMEGLTRRQVLVSVLVYTSAIIPWLLLLVATNKKKCENYVLRTVTICSLVGSGL